MNKGIKKGIKIFRKLIGKKYADKILNITTFDYTGILPANVDNIPETGWMGYCVLTENHGYWIYINPEKHNDKNEIALTVGHELAHIVQDLKFGFMNHEDVIFKTCAKAYCDKLGYKEESF